MRLLRHEPRGGMLAINAQATRADKLADRLGQLETQLAKRDEEVAGLKADAAKRDDEVAAMKAEAAKKDVLVAGQIAALQAAVFTTTTKTATTTTTTATATTTTTITVTTSATTTVCLGGRRCCRRVPPSPAVSLSFCRCRSPLSPTRARFARARQPAGGSLRRSADHLLCTPAPAAARHAYKTL